jgi:tripartite-type tricarboxylate transporter receptor subunit TctC
VKGLAVSSLQRIEQIPDIPTLSETILPGVEFGAWSGMMAPANTPPEIITKLNGEVNKALQNPELRKKITATGAEVRGSTVAQYADFLKSEAKRWGESIKAAGIEPE